jgi:hypothetical protein
MTLRKRLLCFLTAVCLVSVFGAAQQSNPSSLERLGFPADARVLIIHADDLGMSHSVNRATLEALDKGWITSASILVPCPWFPEVARFAQTHRHVDLGIHLALTSEWTDFRWAPVVGGGKVPSLLDAEGYMPLLETTAAAHAKPEEAEIELRAQIEKARAAGIPLSHLDTHMTTLVRSAGLFDVYRRLGKEYGLPILLEKNGRNNPVPVGVTVPASEVLIDQIIAIDPGVPAEEWAEWYKKTLSALKPGIYEMIVHLAYDDEEMRGATSNHPDWGAAWRQSDLDLVRSDDFHHFLEQQNFRLVKWSDLARGANMNPE